MNKIILVFLVFFAVHCGREDTKALDPDLVKNSYQRYIKSKKTSPQASTVPSPKVGVDIMNLAEDQFPVLFHACSQFKLAKQCLLENSTMLSAGVFCSKWEDRMRVERDKLIESGILTRAEYDEHKADYDKNKDICKAKAQEEKSWKFTRELAFLECFRPHVENHIDRTEVYFHCNEI